MKESLLLILVLSVTNLFSQSENKETIPLNQKIQIEIQLIDSMYLEYYNVYEFQYSKNETDISAQYLVFKNEKQFNLGQTIVELCRVSRFMLSDSTYLTGHGTSSRLYFDAGEDNERYLDFQEDSEFPTLILCEVRKK